MTLETTALCSIGIMVLVTIVLLVINARWAWATFIVIATLLGSVVYGVGRMHGDQPTPPPTQDEQNTQTLERNRILNTLLTQGAQSNGWEPMRDRVVVTLTSSDGTVYTGLNVVGMKGYLCIERADSSHILQYRDSEGGRWLYANTPKKKFSIGNGSTTIFLNLRENFIRTAESKTPLNVVLYVTQQDNNLLIRTRRWCAPGHLIKWGRVPTDQNWDLYVRFGNPDGTVIPVDQIQTNPGHVFIDRKHSKSELPVLTTEYQISSGISKEKGGLLSFGIPRIVNLPEVGDPNRSGRILTEVVLCVKT